MDYAKKIMYQSNYWYNDGLKKAQERDMSGAIIALRQSLQYNRENIAARNLLGLVYYGIGEVAEALVEWIISKNLKPRDNIADSYIRNVQDSANELESINQAIKKYNQCLGYCKQNGEDLATIQLKQVIADFPEGLSTAGIDLYSDESEYKGKAASSDSEKAGCFKYNDVELSAGDHETAWKTWKRCRSQKEKEG